MTNFNFLLNNLSYLSSEELVVRPMDSTCFRSAPVPPSFRLRLHPLRMVATLLLLLCLSVGNVWGGATTYTFTSTAWATSQGAWTSDKNASATGDARGISVQKAASGAGAHTASISNITKVAINCSKSGNGVGSIVVKVGTTTVISRSSFNTTDTPYESATLSNLSGAVSFTVTCTTSTIYVKSITITTGSGSSYTITASSSNNSHGTVSVTGTTITATPADCYQVISGAGGYTLNSGTATITHTGTSNTISVTPTANCSITVNFEKKTVNTYVDEIQDNGTTEECDTHDAPSLDDKTPATSGTCAQQHWHFVGWVPAAYKATPRGHITNAGTSMTANGTTYYAVWSKGVAGSDFDGSTEGDYLIYAAVSTTNYYATNSISSGVLSTTTTASSAQTYTFKKSGDYWTISYKSGNTTYYLTAPTGNNVGLNDFSTTSSTWKIATGTYGSWRIWARSTDTKGNNSYAYRALTYNSGTGFKNYCPGSSYYDCEIGAATIYSDSTAICCTELGSINGSFLWSN